MANVKTAVVLAAGKGNRLDVFETPKPLIKVDGKSLVARTVESLQQAGIKDIAVVVEKGNTVIGKELFDYKGIRYIEQVSGKRGMLDSLLSLKGVAKGPFLVTVCDLVTAKNPYKELLKSVKPKDTFGALVSRDSMFNANAGANVRIRFRGNKLEEMGKALREWNALDIGIYYLTDTALKDFLALDKKKKFQSVPDLISAYAIKKDPRVAFLDAQWFDINIPKTLIRAELFLTSQRNGHEVGEAPRGLQKNVSVMTTLTHTKQTVTDIVVKRDILKNIGDYEVIPPECYHSPHHFMVDENIDKKFGDKVFKQFKNLGYRIYKYVLPPGELSKSITGYVELSNQIIKNGLDKKSFVLHLGGGATKDMAGFLASTLYRGIGFISFPTTVLSQADAGIALKQGVNGTDGKNLLGSYYAPEKIIVDPAVLASLPERYISDGLAECIKQAFSYDADFYKMFDEYKGPLNNLDFLEAVIKRAITLKVNSIEQDLHEDKIALVNQYGHEFGHAVEHLSGYYFGHGESVGLGMRISAELSHILGITTKDVVDKHIAMLKKYKLPYKIPENISPEDIIYSLRFNKKYYSGEPRFVLVRKVGEVWRDNNYYTVSCKEDFMKQAIERSYN